MKYAGLKALCTHPIHSYIFLQASLNDIYADENIFRKYTEFRVTLKEKIC